MSPDEESLFKCSWNTTVALSGALNLLKQIVQPNWAVTACPTAIHCGDSLPYSYTLWWQPALPTSVLTQPEPTHDSVTGTLINEQIEPINQICVSKSSRRTTYLALSYLYFLHISRTSQAQQWIQEQSALWHPPSVASTRIICTLAPTLTQ